MTETSADKADILIGLLAQLVAASGSGDPVLALTTAGMKQKEVAKLLGMKPNAVGMRVRRAGIKPKERTNGKEN